MECRICLEEKSLLSDVCRCKGSQRYIHLKCLINTTIYLNSDICPTCKTKYNFNPTKPKLWDYLGSKGFETLLRLFYLGFYQYDSQKALDFAYYNNLFLICLYTYACFQRIKLLTLRDLVFWMQPYIICGQAYYFPLFVLCYIILVYHNGLLLAFYLPYPKLYEIQKVIDNLLL